MAQEINALTLPNGLTLLAERMPHVRSAAFNIMVPAGGVYDPPDRLGSATVLSDLITRGAGEHDSRELSEELDKLGVDRSESVGAFNMHFSGVALARNLQAALKFYADILRRPHLPEDELEAAQALALQDLQGLEDDPQGRVMTELTRRHYPAPLNRDKRGTKEGIEAVSIHSLKAHYAKHFHPRGVVIAVAGDVQWEALSEHVKQLFGDWEPKNRDEIKPEGGRLGGGHLEKDLEQTQIALAYPSVPIGSDDFYNARGYVGVLSQDMASRLFMNVREKHGLCYAVYASYETFKDRASIIAYAGAKPELAQETLDRTLHELRTLKDGIEQDELDRVKVGLKAALIMRQESTSARAGSLASDWFYLGRVRPLSELQQKIDGMTVRSVLNYAERYPVRDVTLVTLGAKPLELKN